MAGLGIAPGIAAPDFDVEMDEALDSEDEAQQQTTTTTKGITNTHSQQSQQVPTREATPINQSQQMHGSTNANVAHQIPSGDHRSHVQGLGSKDWMSFGANTLSLLPYHPLGGFDGPLALRMGEPQGLSGTSRVPRVIQPRMSLSYNIGRRPIGGGKEGNVVAALGTSFRVGWGPNGQLFVPSGNTARVVFVRASTLCTSSSFTESGQPGVSEATRALYIPSLERSREFASIVPDSEQNSQMDIDGDNKSNQFNDAQTSAPQLAYFVDGLNLVEGSCAKDRRHLTRLINSLGQVASEEGARLSSVASSSRPSESLSGRSVLPATAIHRMAAQHAVSVWELVKALWGDETAELDEKEQIGNIGAEGVRNAVYWERYRWVQVQKWLRNTIARLFDEREEVEIVLREAREGRIPEVVATPFDRAGVTTFIQLSRAEFRDAAKTALQAGEHRLALLIQTASIRAQHVRDGIRTQQTVQVNPPHRQTAAYDAVYALLGGRGDLHHILHRILPHVEWHRGLVSFLSLGYGSNNSFKEALVDYINSLGDEVSFVPPYLALGPYFRGATNDATAQAIANHVEQLNVAQRRGVGDLCWGLLRLRGDVAPLSELHGLLSPRSTTMCSLDHRTIFHLYAVLNVLLVEQSQRMVFELGPKICSEFAGQLEMEGLWDWAIYVLLFMPLPTPTSRANRDTMIQGILERHVDGLHTADTIITSLHLPQNLISKVRANAGPSEGGFAGK